MKKLFFACLLFASIFNVHAANPVLTFDLVTGKLTGASGVTVGAALYDVAFMSGTCINRFDGCDSASDFTFSTGDDAILAANVLLDTVLLEDYDKYPSYTLGCISSVFCDIYTPFRVFTDNGLELVSSAVARNWVEGVVDTTGYHSVLTNSEFGYLNLQDKIWAVWSPSQVTAVPEPEIYAMLGVGLGLMGWVGRRRKLQSA